MILRIELEKSALRSANLSLRSKTQELESENARLHQELKYFLSQKYGRKADVVHPGQARLFDEAENLADSASSEAAEDTEEDVLTVPRHTKGRGKRRPLSPLLERRVIVHD